MSARTIARDLGREALWSLSSSRDRRAYARTFVQCGGCRGGRSATRARARAFRMLSRRLARRLVPG
jgi:hypothetical protein